MNGIGSLLRGVGRSIDKIGVSLQGRLGFVERLVPQTTSVAIKDSAPATSNAVFVAPNSSIIGNATLGDGASVWFGCTIRGDLGNGVLVGAGSAILDRTSIASSNIGAGVTIGPNSSISGAHIGDGAQIGANSIVSEGTKIGAGAIIEAGSVVPAGSTVEAGHVYAGNPASSVRAVTKEQADAAVAQVTHNADIAVQYQFESNKSYGDVQEEGDAKQAQEQYESDHWRDANAGRVDSRQGNVYNRRPVTQSA